METLKNIGFWSFCIIFWPVTAIIIYMDIRSLKKRRREVDKELIACCKTLTRQAEHTLKLSKELAKINPGTFHYEK